MDNIKTGRLAGKVALVAGAGCVGPGWGNGRAIATRFAQEGALVFAVDKDLQAMEETLVRVREAGGEATPHDLPAQHPGEAAVGGAPPETAARIEAGFASNIIPETAIMEGTYRALNPATRARTAEAIERIAAQIATWSSTMRVVPSSRMAHGINAETRSPRDCRTA